MDGIIVRLAFFVFRKIFKIMAAGRLTRAHRWFRDDENMFLKKPSRVVGSSGSITDWRNDRPTIDAFGRRKQPGAVRHQIPFDVVDQSYFERKPSITTTTLPAVKKKKSSIPIDLNKSKIYII